MEITKGVFSLIAAMMLLLGGSTALISTIDIVKLQDIFLRSHTTTESPTLPVLLTLIGILIYFIVSAEFFSVRLLLSLVLINLTSPVSMHLVARAAYRSSAYMHRKNDAHTHASILLSSNEQNSTEALQLRAKKREEHRKKWYQDD